MNYPPEDINRPLSSEEPEKGNLPANFEQEHFQSESQQPETPGENTVSTSKENEDVLVNIFAESNLPEPPEFDFSELEANARANIEELGFSPLPTLEPHTPRRRRQRQPIVSRPSEEEVPDRLESMARRAVPTFDFFVFALITGALMGIGYLLDAPAILLLAVIAAPFPAPWLGVSLATATGESRFLGQTLGGFFTAVLVVFLTGLLAGLASRIFMPIILNQVFLHARLWWPDLLLLAIGTAALVVLFIQNDDKPTLPGLILSYELLLPISAAGFGLGNGTSGLWPQALAVFLVHIALSIVLGLGIFYYMGFRPLETSGYSWGAGVILVSLLIVAGFAGLGAIENAPTISETSAPTIPAPTIAPPSLIPATDGTATSTPIPPTATQTPPPQPTQPTATLVVIPTTAYGRIQSKADGDGATIRVAPGGSAITTILNGYLVEILPDAPVILNNSVWIRVKVTTATRVIEGWVLQSLVVTPTPVP